MTWTAGFDVSKRRFSDATYAAGKKQYLYRADAAQICANDVATHFTTSGLQVDTPRQSTISTEIKRRSRSSDC